VTPLHFTSTTPRLLQQDMQQRSRSSSISSQSSETPGSDVVLSTTPQPVRRGNTFHRHNSVVSAMLTSNSLRDCGQVNDMVSKCMSRKEESVMCNTAHRYMANCMVSKP
jgi:hypothetical protein